MQQPFATHLILQMANAIFFRRQICYSLLLIYNIELRSKLISYNTQITLLNSSTIEKQTTKFSSANFQKNGKSKLYHIDNSKTKGQTV